MRDAPIREIHVEKFNFNFYLFNEIWRDISSSKIFCFVSMAIFFYNVMIFISNKNENSYGNSISLELSERSLCAPLLTCELLVFRGVDRRPKEKYKKQHNR